MIDRLSPTRRPEGKNDGTQRWESLLFCHWEFDPSDVEPHLPKGLELDTFEGRAYVGLVPFKMRSIRPSWLPRALAMNFLETNVRTYVVCRDRPGVYFFSLDANSILAVWAAKLGWSLPYFYANMSSDSSSGSHSYSSHRRNNTARSHVSFTLGEELGASKPDTLEHFLFERYLLFVRRKGVMQVGQVHHEPYQVRTASIDEIQSGLVSAAGFDCGRTSPDFVHYSPGVDVEVFATRAV